MKKYNENEIIEIVNIILNQADMCDIIFEPEEQMDEYYNEARVIAGFIHEGITSEYLAAICVDVFEEYFSYKFKMEDFLEVSNCILMNLYE